MDYIYLLESREELQYIYKIGFTKNIDLRIKQLRTANPDLSIITFFKTKHKRKLESTLHKLFSHKHYKQEFFLLEFEDVKNFIPLCNKIEQNLDLLENNKNDKNVIF